MTELLNNLLFIFQRLNWLSVIDILMVTLIFFSLMYWLRDTQAMVLLRGVILIVVALILRHQPGGPAGILVAGAELGPCHAAGHPGDFCAGDPARPGADRAGRHDHFQDQQSRRTDIQQSVHAVVTASARLSARQHGALIIMQRLRQPR